MLHNNIVFKCSTSSRNKVYRKQFNNNVSEFDTNERCIKLILKFMTFIDHCEDVVFFLYCFFVEVTILSTSFFNPHVAITYIVGTIIIVVCIKVFSKCQNKTECGCNDISNYVDKWRKFWKFIRKPFYSKQDRMIATSYFIHKQAKIEGGGVTIYIRCLFIKHAIIRFLKLMLQLAILIVNQILMQHLCFTTIINKTRLLKGRW